MRLLLPTTRPRVRVRLSLVTAASLALFGCAPISQPAPAPIPKQTFSFTPPDACQTPGSVKVTFAIISPQWADRPAQTPVGYQDPVAQYLTDRQALEGDFASAMKDDFMSMLTCKGFTTRGPFRSPDDMVYPDRIGSDLVLEPEIAFNIAVQTEQVQPSFAEALAEAWNPNAKGTVHLQGQATLTGRVTLSAMESVTNTRMWEKTIEVQPESFEFVADRTYPVAYAQFYSRLVTGDPGFLKEYGPRLAAIYKSALKTSWNYLDAREMAMVKQQSLEPRRKAITAVGR
ncbi:MAG: hypothetical protein ACYCVL_00085 [Gemmatimonadaceae bacterium]